MRYRVAFALLWSTPALADHGWATVLPAIDCASVGESCDRWGPGFHYAVVGGVNLGPRTDLAIGSEVTVADTASVRNEASVAIRRWLDGHHWIEFGAGWIRSGPVSQSPALPQGRELFIRAGDTRTAADGEGLEWALKLSWSAVPDETRMMLDVTASSWNALIVRPHRRAHRQSL